MVKKRQAAPHKRTDPKPPVEDPKRRGLGDDEVLEIELTLNTPKDGLVKIPKFECIGISIDPPFVRYHKEKDKTTFDVNINAILHVEMNKRKKLITPAKLVPPVNILG
jgi:hypothetical protein